MAGTQEQQRTSSNAGAHERGNTGSQGESRQQSLTRGSERGGVARPGSRGSFAFPSPSEFFANPFSMMRRVQDEMDRVFAQALGGPGNAGGGLATWSPAIEVKQQGNDLVVCAELPGLKPDEVQVEANDDALIIQGERRQEQTTEEGGVHRTERRYGQFYRAIPLPEGIDPDQAKASFRDGVLEVRMPLPQNAQRSRRIPIGESSQKPQSETKTKQGGGADGGGA